jgi:hypothetical protein
MAYAAEYRTARTCRSIFVSILLLPRKPLLHTNLFAYNLLRLKGVSQIFNFPTFPDRTVGNVLFIYLLIYSWFNKATAICSSYYIARCNRLINNKFE